MLAWREVERARTPINLLHVDNIPVMKPRLTRQMTDTNSFHWLLVIYDAGAVASSQEAHFV